jgi:hypothetical protein
MGKTEQKPKKKIFWEKPTKIREKRTKNNNKVF